MASVLEMVKSNKVISLTKNLIKIQSQNPPGDEKEISEYLIERLKEIGLKVKTYDYKPNRPNVIGTFSTGKKGSTLMFNGHTDTVPIGKKTLWTIDALEGKVKNDKIYGRGASDMKGSLAAMIVGTETVLNYSTEFKGNLILSFVADEEVTGFGTKDLVDRGYKADCAVVGEPTELKVQTAHKGVAYVKIVTKGEAAHGSLPHTGINAINQAVRVCSAIGKMECELGNKKHALLGSPTINIGTIKGGIKTNVVPDYCEMTVDRRLIPGETSDMVKKEFEDVISQLKDKDNNFNAEVDIINFAEPSETSPNERIVKIARSSVKKVIGKDLGVTPFPATCDMRFLVNQAHIPTVILGPGSLHQAHTIDEYVEVNQVLDATKIYALIILKVLGKLTV